VRGVCQNLEANSRNHYSVWQLITLASNNSSGIAEVTAGLKRTDLAGVYSLISATLCRSAWVQAVPVWVLFRFRAFIIDGFYSWA
jgi:hypothetical protein